MVEVVANDQTNEVSCGFDASVEDTSGKEVIADDLANEDNSGLSATDENTLGVEDHAAVDLTNEECWALMEDVAIDGEVGTKNMIWEKN